MRRIHIALAVADLEVSIDDYSGRLGAPPVAVVPGKYALWRTPEVNLSINCVADAAQPLRHLGFEDDAVVKKSAQSDANGLLWESFNSTLQDEEIIRAYGAPHVPGY
jgi:catechol 2,3-dioxygenase-like lactoylglutathione lyase family enzyme